jgi:hypothetical protein
MNDADPGRQVVGGSSHLFAVTTARIVTFSHMGVQDRKAREFQRRADDTLKAALALSNRDDWQAVTIEQIAQKAEIGKGTVHRHFPRKG